MKRSVICLLLAMLFLFSACDRQAENDGGSDKVFSLEMLDESEKRQYDELLYVLNKACDYELSEAVAYSYAECYKSGDINTLEVISAQKVDVTRYYDEDAPNDSYTEKYIVVYTNSAAYWFKVNDDHVTEIAISGPDGEHIMAALLDK